MFLALFRNRGTFYVHSLYHLHYTELQIQFQYPLHESQKNQNFST